MTVKKKINNQPERRIITAPVEYRAAAEGEGESRLIGGYACRFNERSELMFGSFYEVIDSGAFEGVDLSDVVCRGNHDNNELLGRTSNGTLKLELRNDGLFYECDVTPTTKGNDWLTLIKRADVDKSSFAFWVKEDNWETLPDGKELRTIKKFEIVTDVAPVTRPAYGGSSVEKRDAEPALEGLKAYREKRAGNTNEELREAENIVCYYKQLFN